MQITHAIKSGIIITLSRHVINAQPDIRFRCPWFFRFDFERKVSYIVCTMLEIKKCCLVVVDVQGKLASLMDNKESLFANIAVLIKAAKALDIPILWCQQNPKALGLTIPQLAQLMEDIDPVDKFSFSCYGDEKFLEKIKNLNVRDIILCGIESHICVYQTAMDLLDADYDVHLIADAVSSRTPANKAIAIQRLTTEGANLSSTEMTLFELLRTAKHTKFKELARLIK